jgi:hypothetical protein
VQEWSVNIRMKCTHECRIGHENNIIFRINNHVQIFDMHLGNDLNHK